jgi:ABC-type transporter MlaC component
MTNKFVFCRLLLVCIAIFVSSQSVYGANAKAPVETLISLFSKEDGLASDKSTLNEAAQHIDYQYMAHQSLGSANWDKLTNQQQSTYVSALQSVIEKRYYPRWHRIFSKSTVFYGKESGSETESHITTDITVGKSHENIDWTVRHAGTQAKVVNLSVNGKDILVRLGQRFQKKYAQGGFDKFIAWLQGLSKSSSTAKSDSGVD